jgi:CHAD domain-containing protein
MVFPAVLLQAQIETLLTQLPAVRNAEVEGVHAARVATRRLREALPLFSRSHPGDVQRVKRLVKRAGRRLGRVRELDVMDAELARRAGRMPMALPTIAAARKALARRQSKARRRVIRTLDDLRLEGREPLQLRRRNVISRTFGGASARGWAEVLRDRMARRADNLSRAIDHAGGVFFPKRLHNVRVAVKKLRYSAELAGAAGLWHCDDVLAELKRTQDTLGHLHDAEVLRRSIDTLVGDIDVDQRELAMLKDDLHGEIAERHVKYVAQLERLRGACQACAGAAATLEVKRSPFVPLVALSAVAVPVGLLLLGARDR